MWLIVGLGNPGDRYRNSRHNLGFWCIDSMASRWGITVNERRAKAVLGRGARAGQDVVLAKPRTFMNNSGEGVDYLLTRFAAPPTNLVIVYDEMELPVGTLRLRPSGSDGGHNGIRSIIAALHSQTFPAFAWVSAIRRLAETPSHMCSDRSQPMSRRSSRTRFRGQPTPLTACWRMISTRR